jgi:hypothetical protein
MQHLKHLNLTNLSLPLRVLFTGYLLVVSTGLLTAGFQIMMTHGMADGEFGLSVNDVVYSYYGNRENSKLEVKLNGSMKDKANTQERAQIIKWVRSGSSLEEWTSTIQPIVNRNCVMCHGGVPGLPNFTTYEGIKPEAKIDEGSSISDLTRVSHIHLFGIAFIFFFICIIFSLATRTNLVLKSFAIGAPFLFIIVDIFSWWLTKWYPSFAYTTIIGGMAYNLAAAYMILTSLYQMWVMPWRGLSNNDDPWMI